MKRTNAHSKNKLSAHEYKIIRLRETSPAIFNGSNSKEIASYWKSGVATSECITWECECLVVIILDSRYRIRGHQLVSIGTLDTLLCHPREVFRTAIILSAFAVILAHNHPSGDPLPSVDDIQATHDIARAGRHIGIPVLDHII